jgi:hypothetical protein
LPGECKYQSAYTILSTNNTVQSGTPSESPSDFITRQVAEVERLTAENAALREERALIIQRAENAEAALVASDALLRDIAEMRVPVLPSRFMDESMAEAARAHLARKP